jgi:hypothetical protein
MKDDLAELPPAQLAGFYQTARFPLSTECQPVGLRRQLVEDDDASRVGSSGTTRPLDQLGYRLRRR